MVILAEEIQSTSGFEKTYERENLYVLAVYEQ